MTDEAPAPARVRPYAWYVLSLFVLVYIVNFVDRQVVSILAEDIKADLGVDDSDLGFLYGTAFGVFYSLFGIPLGRLADNWNRIRLMTIGLTVWSAMTVLSGFSRNFGQLAVARIGVGVGEATASPCAFSVLSDYFPKEKRATALGIYSSGLYIGAGLSLFIGGLVVERWNAAYPAGGPLGLMGWQAAFLAVGLPGLLLAIWIATIREPVRGLSEGLDVATDPHPWKLFFDELASVIPPFTIFTAAKSGPAALTANLAVLAAVVAAGWALIASTGNVPQWLAIGLGVYAVFSWQQSLRRRDLPTWRLIWGTPSFLLTVVGFGSIAFATYATGFWGPVYAIREFGADKAMAGLILGGGAAAGGFIGTILGGRLGDQFRLTNPSGRILVGFFVIFAWSPLLVWQFQTGSLNVFYVLAFVNGIIASMWVGVAAATAQDLVLPQMRGAATATYFLGTTLLGLAMGPYTVGKVSELTGDLGLACISVMALFPLVLLCLTLLYRWLPAAEATKLTRAGVTL